MALRTLAALFAVPLLAASVAFGLANDPPAASPSAPAEPPSSGKAPDQVFVLMETSMGDIVVRLEPEKAPVTVENFLRYVDKGFYDGLVFHRVIPTFMIQGGGFTPDMKQKTPEAPIRNESFNGLPNVRGSIAMARLNAPDTASSQFFINVKDNPELDGNAESDKPGYAVFGMVVAGMDTVDKIKAIPTGTSGGHRNVPVEPVVVKRVSRLKPEDAAKRIEPSKPAAS